MRGKVTSDIKIDQLLCCNPVSLLSGLPGFVMLTVIGKIFGKNFGIIFFVSIFKSLNRRINRARVIAKNNRTNLTQYKLRR